MRKIAFTDSVHSFGAFGPSKVVVNFLIKVSSVEELHISLFHLYVFTSNHFPTYILCLFYSKRPIWN